MMRRVCCAFVSVLIVSLFSCSSFAADGITHYIPDKDISVFVPFDILCVTREADETNTFYQNKYFDYKTVHDYMLNNNLYLYGMTSDYQGEFALMITDYGEVDFNSASDLELSVCEMQMKNTFASQGVKDVKSDIYQGTENKAIRLSYTYEATQGNQYVSFYFTTHASNLYTFRFISFFKPTSASQENVFRSVFESIEWGKQNYTAEAKGETDINIYSDYETGLTFMVPSAWCEVKFVAGDEGKKVKYRIGTENVWVLYESGDLWDTFRESYGSMIDTLGMTRADFNNDFLSEEMVSQWLQCSDSDTITKKTINGQEYYCTDKTTAYTSGGLTLENHDLVYICMRDAYLYWFQLSGTDISRFEDQFNRFMRTVEYP